MSKNLIARIIVAAIFIPAILWISYEGGWWLYGMVMFFAAGAMSEFLVAEGYSLKRPAFWLVLLMTLFIVTNSIGGKGIFGHLFGIKVVGTVIFIFLVSGMLFGIGKRQPSELMSSHSRLMWGLLYISLLYPFVYELWLAVSQAGTLKASGGDALLFLFALLWIGDTAAMWVGKSFGKHKLAPSVSPNKTVEGFVGGLVSAGIVGLVMGLWKFEQFPLYQIILVGIVCSLFGQLGDLVESMWKRSLGIKDSSAIIPGHGGILDRFDSLLFAAPVMYYFFVIFR